MTSLFSVACLYYHKGRFTHVIQLWHDGTAAPHFKLKQVEYLLRMAQGLQDVHAAAGVGLFL